MSGNTPDPETLARVYRSLRLIRRTEEEIARLYPSDKIKSPVHLSIGQESVSVGVCDALNDDDMMSATYRGHAAYLAKGGDLNQMMAELYGKGTGGAGGKAGSMHLVDMKAGVLGMSAVVGTTIPIAAGYAFAMKREGRPSGEGRITAGFFGDGATEEGVFSETLNFAALHKLPILFVCENNGFAIHSPLSNRWATEALCERVRTYGIPTHEIDDADVFTIRRTAVDAIQAIRAGEGPQFMECKTYRWREHVGPGEDYDDDYRTRDELAPWQENDAMATTGEMLDAAERDAIDKDVEQRIAEAIAFAEQSPWPEPEELFSHVYAD
ncbi:MAG: thiamine pyrophosphate-dependent dehydrogenase E1 component subunit alpha [Rhodospirillales bacterium]|nr:thiamine pyrophosphate-dependent dehydrogenase E1 component subunit alpha [Alphaproteobacteria bacterium]MBL6948617.1 thiamine pyrophosphate-dependent dehydrogenase E1 component subunit alpha [Rhodospirillales bacterium]